MTVAILSDTHLGDRSSRLVDANGRFDANLPAYQKLRQGILAFTGGTALDYLVLCGDIMDFAIGSISESICIARPFFAQVAADRLTKNVVYVPGNHDKQVWDGLQWDTSVIGNLSDYRNPSSFARIQPAVITRKGEISLEGLPPEKGGGHGDIFLKGLFGRSDENPKIILAYPNLYLERQGETIIVTHGHMFETAWVLLSDLLHGVAGVPDEPSLRDLEEWNVPLTSMICTGLGSGGKVSDLFCAIQREVYEQKTDTLRATLELVLPRIKDEFQLGCLLRLLLPNWMIQHAILSAASKAEDPRAHESYLDDEMKAKHFELYLRATRKELQRLGLPTSDTIVFGHTHHPFGCQQPYRPKQFPNLTLYNCGGWLRESEAAIFLVDDARFESFAA